MRRPRTVTPKDETDLKDLVHAVERMDVGRVPALQLISNPLRDLLRASNAGGYMWRATPEGGVRYGESYLQLPSAVVAEEVNASLACCPIDHWTHYNPLCPQPDQRNRVLRFRPEEAVTVGLLPVFRKFSLLGHQLRALLCEGPSLLAWFGGFADEPTEREVWLLEQLIEPMRKRLLLERRLEMVEQTSTSVDLAIEQIPGAVFVVNAAGQVLHANSAGRRRIDKEGMALLTALRHAVAGDRSSFEAHASDGAGQPTQYLLVSRPTSAAHHRVHAAASRWRLTGRQTQVLACLIQGYSNARVSAELGISERTVEVHLTAILSRAQCSSRAELISAVLLSS